MIMTQWQRRGYNDMSVMTMATATTAQRHWYSDTQPWISTHMHPSPLQREVLHARQTIMRRRTQGGTQEVGGPANASRKWTTTFVMVRFCPSLHVYPLSTIYTAQKLHMWPIENMGSLAMAHTTYQRQVQPINDMYGPSMTCTPSTGHLSTTMMVTTMRPPPWQWLDVGLLRWGREVVKGKDIEEPRKSITMEQSHGSALSSSIFVILYVPRHKPEEGWPLLVEIWFIASY